MTNVHLQARAAWIDVSGGLLVAGIVFLLVGGGLAALGARLILPATLTVRQALGVAVVAMGARPWLWVMRLLFHLAPAAAVARWIAQYGDESLLLLVDALALPAGIAAGIGAGIWAAQPPKARQVRGRVLVAGRAAVHEAAREFAPHIDRSGRGIEIAPGVAIDLERETRGFFIIGGIGSGKTTIIHSWIRQIIERGDKLILYDLKGDYTAMLCAESVRHILLAPWDARSWAWDMAADIQTQTAAREWAKRMIPDSSDPLWGSGAQMILAALAQAEIRERAGRWGPQDIARAVQLAYPAFRDRVLAYAPEATQLLGEPDKKTGAPNRTVQGFLANLAAFLAPVFDLADAYSADGHGGPIKKFSLRKWLLNDDAKPRIVVIQGHGDHDLMARGLAQTVVGIVAGIVASPQLPDSPDRRIWMVLDEVPQLRKIEGLPRLLEVGRSKGLRMVYGAQDKNQIIEHYGPHLTNALTAMVGTLICGCVGGVETPRWISDLVGEGEYLIPAAAQSRSAQSGMNGNVQHSMLRETHAIVTPADLGVLGGHAKGIDALMIPGGDHVYRLTWPYQLRTQPMVPPAAPWTLPGWPSTTAAIGAALAAARQERKRRRLRPRAHGD